MNFIMGLPQTFRDVESIWVIMDQSFKLAHSPLIQFSFSTKKLARVYIRKVVHLHRVPVYYFK